MCFFVNLEGLENMNLLPLKTLGATPSSVGREYGPGAKIITNIGLFLPFLDREKLLKLLTVLTQ